MRLFIALQISPEMQELSARVQEHFRRQRVRGNYVPRENLHVTLVFIGEYGDPDRILELMESVAFRPFTITMDRIGSFGDLWWTGFAESEELRNLAAQIRHILADADVRFDKARFRPHVTILRKAQFRPGGLEPMDIRPVRMTVRKVSLMQSTQGRNGMIYTELGSVSAL